MSEIMFVDQNTKMYIEVCVDKDQQTFNSLQQEFRRNGTSCPDMDALAKHVHSVLS